MAQNNRRGRSGRRRSGGNQGNNPNRSIDSQGPEVKIRGNAQQVYDKYTALARDAFSSGDRIRAESLQQHAEHYYRVLQAMKPPEQKDGQKEQPRHDGQQDGRDQSGQSAGANGHDRSGDQDGHANADTSGDAERRPRRERKRREERSEPQVTDQAEPARAEEPSDRAGVEKEGHETPEGSEAPSSEASGEEEAKPRRRRRTRRKSEDDGGEAKGDPASEEVPAA